jgi:hypothetical protein
MSLARIDTLTTITCQYRGLAHSRSQQNQSLAIVAANPKRLRKRLYWVNVSMPFLFLICEGYLTRAQDPKDANTPAIYTWHAARLIRQAMIVGEFIPHDSSLPFGSSNHDPAACLNSEHMDPSEAKP